MIEPYQKLNVWLVLDRETTHKFYTFSHFFPSAWAQVIFNLLSVSISKFLELLRPERKSINYTLGI